MNPLHARTRSDAERAVDPLAEALSLVAAGDERGLARLYEATARQVFGWTLRILRDPALAEEATLDVFMQVWRQAARYDAGRGSVRSFVLMLARSRAIDLLRARTRERRVEEAMSVGGAALPVAGPDEAVDEDQRARRVREALHALPPEQRRVIEAAFFGGLSHSEVAEAHGLPLGTVKTRIRAGLATLRLALGDAQWEWA